MIYHMIWYDDLIVRPTSARIRFDYDSHEMLKQRRHAPAADAVRCSVTETSHSEDAHKSRIRFGTFRRTSTHGTCGPGTSLSLIDSNDVRSLNYLSITLSKLELAHLTRNPCHNTQVTVDYVVAPLISSQIGQSLSHALDRPLYAIIHIKDFYIEFDQSRNHLVPMYII